MIFTAINPDGTREKRRHVPYTLKQNGSEWLAYHSETGRLLGRYATQEIAVQSLNSRTEPAE